LGPDRLTAGREADDTDWLQLTDRSETYLSWVTAFDHVTASPVPPRTIRPIGVGDTKHVDQAAVDYILTLEGAWDDP